MRGRRAGKSDKVVGYIRVSTDEQVLEGQSLERQEFYIREFCAQKGISADRLEIISEKEGRSGFKSNRPGFQRVIKLCRSRQVSMVVVYHLDRLSRNVRDTLSFVEDVIQPNGVEFVSIQHDIDTSTPIGKAFLGFSAIFAQLYRDEISFKTKAALRHKQAKGEKIGGLVPFGYCLVDGFRLAPKPGEIEVLREMHHLRGTGLSLREIIRVLEARGIPTKTGKKKWNPKMVRQILARQVLEISHSLTLSDGKKDHVLQDAMGALFAIPEVVTAESEAV